MLVAAATLLPAAPPAAAHAEVRESDPEPGGVAGEGLDRIEIAFLAMDPEGPVSIAVVDSAGDDWARGEPQVSPRDSVVVVRVRPLDVGAYTVAWQVEADDGDGTSTGEFTFTVEDTSTNPVGLWLIWIVALGVPAVLLFRPRRRTARP